MTGHGTTWIGRRLMRCQGCSDEGSAAAAPLAQPAPGHPGYLSRAELPAVLSGLRSSGGVDEPLPPLEPLPELCVPLGGLRSALPPKNFGSFT
jgi:hypothetical protein